MSNLQEYPERRFLLKLTNHHHMTDIFNSNMNSYYKSMYTVLADLEKYIQFKDILEEVIMIPYKEFGDVIFRLKRVERQGRCIWAHYEFDTTIS